MTKVASPTRKMFVGIKVPLSLARLLTDFRRTQLIDDEGIQWSGPNDLHITLKFIGAVAATTITQILGTLGNIHSARFEVYLSGADVFQDVGVLVVDMQRDVELMSLQSTIAAALSGDGASSNGPAYRPHITLARWKNIATDQQSSQDVIRTQLDQYCQALPAKSFLVTEIILYETVSGHYRIVKEFKVDG